MNAGAPETELVAVATSWAFCSPTLTVEETSRSVPSAFLNAPPGMLNDESSPVSRVHLGVVFLVDGDTPNIAIRETDKLAGELLTLEEMRIYYLGMESWSQMVYDRLARGELPL